MMYFMTSLKRCNIKDTVEFYQHEIEGTAIFFYVNRQNSATIYVRNKN